MTKTNLVAFRSRTWCHNDRCGPTTTYPLRAMAMTTPYPSGSARPEEADVELNAVGFRLTGTEDAGAKARAVWSAPIQPVLVHELGHVLGLSDVCGSERRASGRPVTSACSPEKRGRVMFVANHSARPAPADVAELCRLHAQEARALESVPAVPPPTAAAVDPGLLISAAMVGLALAVARRRSV